ncbi:MAG: hypothetical protein ABGY09_03690 [Euryarchaeota archaeon]
MRRVLLALMVALAGALMGAGAAEAKAYGARYTIKPVIKSVQAPAKVQLKQGQKVATVNVTAVVSWTGNYPYTVRRTKTTVTFAVDGSVVHTAQINPPYRIGDTRTVTATLTMGPGKHTVTVTARFPDLPQYGIQGGTATKEVTIEVVAPTAVAPAAKPVHLAGAAIKDLLLAPIALVALDALSGYQISGTIDSMAGLGLKDTIVDTLDSIGIREYLEKDVVAGAGLTAALLTDLLAGWAMDHNQYVNTLTMLDVGTMLAPIVTLALYVGNLATTEDVLVDLGEQLGLGGSAVITTASAAGLAVPALTTAVGYLADKGVAQAAQITAPVVRALDQLLTTLASPIVKYL